MTWRAANDALNFFVDIWGRVEFPNIDAMNVKVALKEPASIRKKCLAICLFNLDAG